MDWDVNEMRRNPVLVDTPLGSNPEVGSEVKQISFGQYCSASSFCKQTVVFPE